MRISILPVWILALGALISACGTAPGASASNSSPAPSSVEDQSSLVAALQAAGATVSLGGSISQPFFSVEGTMIKVNEADVQVFEYESVEEMELESSQIASDGAGSATTMITWVDTPHFYKTGRVIVLYVGSHQGSMLLTMGPNRKLHSPPDRDSSGHSFSNGHRSCADRPYLHAS